MQKTRQSSSEGGATELNQLFLPRSVFQHRELAIRDTMILDDCRLFRAPIWFE